jgi:hypothetical protein
MGNIDVRTVDVARVEAVPCHCVGRKRSFGFFALVVLRLEEERTNASEGSTSACASLNNTLAMGFVPTVQLNATSAYSNCTSRRSFVDTDTDDHLIHQRDVVTSALHITRGV